MISRRIEFEKLLNTRDLGGMTGADGRKVKPGKLFRSGHLFAASESDLRKLSDLIELSVDFRSEQECLEKSEPEISGVSSIHLPILPEAVAGVTRDEESFAVIRERMTVDASLPRKYMHHSYDGFVTNPFSVSQYGRFTRLLLEKREKGILWHCTAGKDRAGFGTVIVQEMLGVSRDDIAADYMLTNVCLEPEIRSLTEMLCRKPGVDPEIVKESVNYIFAANIEYLDTAYAAAEQHYGSFENYIHQGLHITPEELETFRELYLE